MCRKNKSRNGTQRNDGTPKNPNPAPLNELLSKSKIVSNEKNLSVELPAYGWFIGKQR